MKTKAVYLMSFLLFTGVVFSEEKGLEAFSDAASNVVVGTVYYVSEYSFGVSADWELKGRLGLAGCDVAFSDGRKGGHGIQAGDKVIVFIHREGTAILQYSAALNLKASRPDDFTGQCAYRKVATTGDHAFISRVYDAVGDKQLASAFSF